ncbi:hypothetical protein M8818_002382 [Zalaria obscura]|uniref:Uncharacterized protein n=1 Tax=Zalaria obscura TaxID=2024903 RepID=A0ACC3SII6_9PEZI
MTIITVTIELLRKKRDASIRSPGRSEVHRGSAYHHNMCIVQGSEDNTTLQPRYHPASILWHMPQNRSDLSQSLPPKPEQRSNPLNLWDNRIPAQSLAPLRQATS